MKKGIFILFIFYQNVLAQKYQAFDYFQQSDSIWSYGAPNPYKGHEELKIKGSLAFSLKKGKFKKDKTIIYNEFKLNYNEIKYNFWIGLGNNTFYFYEDKCQSKKTIINSVNLIKGKEIIIYPFSNDYSISVESIENQFGEIILELKFISKFKRMNNYLTIKTLTIYSKYGLIFELIKDNLLFTNSLKTNKD